MQKFSAMFSRCFKWKCQCIRRSICGRNRRSYILSCIRYRGVASERESSEITVDYVKKACLFVGQMRKEDPDLKRTKMPRQNNSYRSFKCETMTCKMMQYYFRSFFLIFSLFRRCHWLFKYASRSKKNIEICSRYF